MRRYSYNRDYKPSLVEAVRDVLKQAQTPLTKTEIVEAVKPLNIASYEVSDAVSVILGRMSRGGEVIKENSTAGRADD